MTNTIPNVPRELLADLLGNDHDKRIMAERHLLAMLANAPSPAGVDGLRGDAAALSGRHTLATVALNYDSTDTGFCRVYYRHLRDLFAYQMTQRGQFVLFACTKDGEPSHEVDYKQVDQLPRDYPEFAVWATDNNLVA